MAEKVKYNCKNCGWSTSIRAEWADMSPKRCMNKKCNTSFVATPDALETIHPIVEVPQTHKPRKFKKNDQED